MLVAMTLVGVASNRSAMADEEEHPPKGAPPVELVMKALGVLSVEPPALTREQRKIADDAGQRLVSLCPDCRPSTITEEGPCGWARVNRQIIRNAVAAGQSEDDIVATYVRVYGPRVLSVSKDSGFAAASWAVPYAVAVLSLVALLFVGRRLRTKKAPSTDPVAASPGPGSVDAKALREELSSLD